MELEQQVCTLEQAKRLKKLGCKQGKSFAYWEFEEKNGFADLYVRNKWTKRSPKDKVCDAYNVAELGEILIKHTNYLPCWNGEKLWRHDDLRSSDNSYASFPTEAQARAELLIQELSNKKARHSSVLRSLAASDTNA